MIYFGVMITLRKEETEIHLLRKDPSRTNSDHPLPKVSHVMGAFLNTPQHLP